MLSFPLKILPVLADIFLPTGVEFLWAAFSPKIARGCLCDAVGHPHSVI